MADSDNKNPMTKQEFIKQLRAMLDSLKDEGMNEKPQPKPQKKDEMVWFSMNENGTDFLSSADAPTTWAGEREAVEEPPMSPDLAVFIHGASSLLSKAMFTPISSGKARMSDFFDLVKHGHNVLKRESYSHTDRKVYEDWCKGVADALDKASSTGGLWLTDGEETLLTSMKSGIFGGVA